MEAIEGYAASVYGHRVDVSYIQNRLRSAQRSALLGLCKAYQTTSTLALYAIAGVLPLDLLVKKRVALYTLRRDDVAVIGGETITEEGGVLTNEVRNHVREVILQLREKEWQTTETSRRARSFLPSIDVRMDRDWLVPKKAITWPFAAYFERFAFKPIVLPYCHCGQLRIDRAHVLIDCPVWAPIARKHEQSLGEPLGRPFASLQDWFFSEQTYKVFAGYAVACTTPSPTGAGGET